MFEPVAPFNRKQDELPPAIPLSSDSSGSIGHGRNLSAALHENGSGSGSSSSRRLEGHSTHGLPDTNFNVLSADKSETLSIPPEFIEPTTGSKNYVNRSQSNKAPTFSFYLCKMYISGSTCTHGSLCDFIHSRHVLEEKPRDDERVKMIRVHWSTPVHSLAEALYERHEPGSVFYINQGNGGNIAYGTNGAVGPRRLISEHVYKTKGSEEALETGSTKLLRFCKHYEREKCARGEMCNFIHPVRFLLQPPPPPPPPPRHSYSYSHVQQQSPSNQMNGSNLNLYQDHGGVHQPPSTNTGRMAGMGPVQPHHTNLVSFGPRGGPQQGNGVITPSSHQKKHQQMPNTSRGYSFAPVYTSQHTSYAGNSAAPVSAASFRGSAAYYNHRPQHNHHHHHHYHHHHHHHQQQQQQQDVQQLQTGELSRQSMVPMSSAPDYLISQLLFTFM